MTYDDLIDYYGSAAKAGDAIGLTRQGVFRWKETFIPLVQQVEYEVLTNGELLADLPASIRKQAA